MVKGGRFPEDDSFLPSPPEVEVIVYSTGGAVSASAMTVSPQEQAAINHNSLRYHELWKLRRGMPNEYHQTEYWR